MYDKEKTKQKNSKPTRKVVAASWANAIILLVVMLTGMDLEPGLQENVNEILTALIVSGGGGLATFAAGWFRNPAKGDQVEE